MGDAMAEEEEMLDHRDEVPPFPGWTNELLREWIDSPEFKRYCEFPPAEANAKVTGRDAKSRYGNYMRQVWWTTRQPLPGEN